MGAQREDMRSGNNKNEVLNIVDLVSVVSETHDLVT
jgi:hypothetical protein